MSCFFFLSENFQFLDVKFSIYLNRRVFVTKKKSGKSIKCIEPLTYLSTQLKRDTRFSFKIAHYENSSIQINGEFYY